MPVPKNSIFRRCRSIHTPGPWGPACYWGRFSCSQNCICQPSEGSRFGIVNLTVLLALLCHGRNVSGHWGHSEGKDSYHQAWWPVQPLESMWWKESHSCESYSYLSPCHSTQTPPAQHAHISTRKKEEERNQRQSGPSWGRETVPWPA